MYQYLGFLSDLQMPSMSEAELLYKVNRINASSKKRPHSLRKLQNHYKKMEDA